MSNFIGKYLVSNELYDGKIEKVKSCGMKEP